MTNPNTPFGLRPTRHMFGGVIRENEYKIADAYGTALYVGDPVLATGTDTNIGIAAAAADGKITGVFNGCKYRNTLGDTIFSKVWPAAQATYNAEGAVALVYDDPFIEYDIMFDNLVAADIRAIANLVSGTGNAQTGQSAWTAIKPPGSTENQLKIVSLSGTVLPGGIPNAFGLYAVARVLLNTHEFHYKAETNI